jgi:hypothetical protein
VRDVGAFRVHRDRAPAGGNHEIHVLHGHSAQEDLIPQNQGTHETGTVLESHLDRPHVGHFSLAPVGDADLPLRFRLQLQLQGHVLGNAQHQRAGIGQRSHPHCLEVRQAWIAQLDIGENVSHALQSRAEKPRPPLAQRFDLDPKDLNLDLGPLGKLI